MEVAEGESVKFRCKVKGYPQPRVTWYKDGQLLSSQLNYKLGKRKSAGLIFHNHSFFSLKVSQGFAAIGAVGIVFYYVLGYSI